MLYGIGTDICDVRRIAAAMARHGPRFAQRVLGPQEWVVFQARFNQLPARGVRYVATRFAAKEAFSKAIGLGLTAPMAWRDCEIINTPSGMPQVQLHGALAAWFAARQLHAHVSLSDEVDHAVGFVIIEKLPENPHAPTSANC
jgi:holo-[acyl-carrier protein] synthase